MKKTMLLIMILLVATHAELYSMDPNVIKSMEKIETIKAQVEVTREMMKTQCVSYPKQTIEDLLEKSKEDEELKDFYHNDFYGNDKKKCKCCSCICF